MNYFDMLKNMTVLLADDDTIFRDSLSNSLNVFVERVITVADGRAALERFASGVADIVILDISMPLLNGLDVARKIREKDSVTPLFIITSFNDTEYLRNAIPLQLVEYLIKPLTFDQLQNALIKCVKYLEKQGKLSYSINQQTSYNKLSGELKVDGGTPVVLPKREKLLLDLLLQNRNRLLEKSFLEDYLFEFDCTDTSLKNLIYRLKKKLPAEQIINVRDLGYMFVDGK